MNPETPDPGAAPCRRPQGGHGHLVNKLILLVGIILMSGLTALWLKERESAARLQEQNQSQQQELAQLTAENERLSKSVPQPSTQRGTEDHQLTELLRSRNEISTLRRLTNAPRLVEHVRVDTNVSVCYDPAIWKPLPEPPGSLVRSMTWEIQREGWIQITVGNYPERKTESDYKQHQLDVQRVRGSPAELAGERHESWGGREWFVLEFHNPNYRPARIETSYFLPTDGGHVSLFLSGEEASVSAHREAIETFLSQIKVAN